jgi:hypothetical protein
VLGPKVPKSPTICPKRGFDPSHLWLMHCNGGPGMRNERKGLHLFCTEKDTFVNIVFQCILVEVFCLQFLIGWSIQIHGHGIQRLPTIEDMDFLLNFVDSVMDGNSWMTLRNILQTQ